VQCPAGVPVSLRDIQRKERMILRVLKPGFGARSQFERNPYAISIAAAVASLATAAIVNHYLAKKAERDNQPIGQFIEVDGVRLHYLDRGSGEPIVLLHGNGSMIQDFQSSGLIEIASQKYRVIAFDRPGFGHSARPRRTIGPPKHRPT
jgi:alpha/beta hydrolase fold